MGTCLVSTGRLSLCAERGVEMEEEWRAIVEFPYYETSSLGRVRKVKRLCNMDTAPPFVPLKPHLRKGYEAVHVGNPGGPRFWVSVHVLVLEAFISSRPPDHVAHHKDTNIRHNEKDNLEWVTYSENVQKAFECGNLCQRGSRNNSSLLKEEQVIEIKKLLATRTLRHDDIALMFGVARNTITQIRCGINWGYLEV